MLFHSLLAAAAVGAIANAAPASSDDNLSSLNVTTNAYAPTTAKCPSTSLVRPAKGLNSQETKYISTRRPKANAGLAKWLKKQGSFSTSDLPSVGFTSSGGGLRALLATAGVMKALDARDSNLCTSGIYQGLTYQAGLSGGAWFLSSLAANNWPTVSSLVDGLWESAFADSLLLPSNLLVPGGLEYVDVVADVVAKQAAGYNTTIVDVYGRLLSYSLLYGDDGGVADRLSKLVTLSNYTNAQVPFPIMTTLGVLDAQGQCYPDFNATIYEFTPYEYGSWDKGISAFANTKYMGSNLNNGKPVHSNACTQNYDNIGYVFGTSSDVFNAVCPSVIVPSNSTDDLLGILEGVVAQAHTPATTDTLALYPNPFYNYPRSSMVNKQSHIAMVDGGEADQNVPIWPFVAGARNLDVLIANDNSADNSENFPNGTELHHTYLNAQQYGHKRMPFIPDVMTFVTEGLNKRATFFGCNETDTMFIIYLPNVNYTFPSNEPTSKLQYSAAETEGMIQNGMEVATQNGTAGWPFCFACGIMSKSPSLPAGCDHCFSKYCYKEE